MPRLLGPSHADLTVTDVERSARWWQDVMGFVRINQFEQPTFRGCGLWHRSGFTATVLSHDETGQEAFDERRATSWTSSTRGSWRPTSATPSS